MLYNNIIKKIQAFLSIIHGVPIINMDLDEDFFIVIVPCQTISLT